MIQPICSLLPSNNNTPIFYTSLIKDRVLWIVILLSAGILCLAMVKPLGYDNALIQSMALDMYRYGRLPYINVWGNHNVPGIIYIHYLAITLFGTRDIGLRIFDSLIQLSFAAFLFRFWSRWCKPHTAGVTAILYIAYYVSAGSLLLSEPDLYGGMLLVVAFAFIIQPHRSVTKIIVSGIIAGMTVLIRPTSLLFLAILSLYLHYASNARTPIHRMMEILIFGLSGITPLLLFLAYYARIPEGLQSIYLQAFRWNFDLYIPIDNGYAAFLAELGRRAFIVPFALYAVIRRRHLAQLLKQVPNRNQRLLWFGLLSSGFFIALLMRKYFSYHFAPFFILLMPLTALGIEEFALRFKGALARHYALVISCIACTFIAYPPKSPFAFLLGMIEKQNPAIFTYEMQFRDVQWGAVPELATVNYLSKPENDTGIIEICSFDPHLRIHIGRECAGMYPVLVPIACRIGINPNGTPHYTDYQMQWQQAYLDSLRSKQPRFIILARGTHYAYLDDPYESFLKWLPGFDSLLSSSYRYDTSFGGYQIYRHINP